MVLPPRVPDWMRPRGLPLHRMPSAQALQRLKSGNQRHLRQLTGATAGGDITPAAFPYALVVGCLEPGAASEELFAERPGAIECLRTAGPSLGSDAVAAIEFAALVQNVGVVLILGHPGCAALASARAARGASGLNLTPALAEWVRTASAGTGGDDPVLGHVRALRARLRAADALLTLTRGGQLKIAGGVLDPVTREIDFLPDEPDDFVEDGDPQQAPDPTRYGS